MSTNDPQLPPERTDAEQLEGAIRFAGDPIRPDDPHEFRTAPDSSQRCWDRVRDAMLGAFNADNLEREGQLRSLEHEQECRSAVDSGKLSETTLHAERVAIEERFRQFAVQAQVLAAFAELERLWTGNGGTLPLPPLRDMSALVTKTEVYEVLQTVLPYLAPVGDSDANVSRAFETEVVKKGVYVLGKSRRQVSLNLRQLRTAHPKLSDEAIASLRRAER